MDIEIIGAAIGCGARDARTQDGPEQMHKWGLQSWLTQRGLRSRYEQIIRAESDAEGPQALPEIAKFSRELATAVRHATTQHRFPIVLGGDHSCAIGTWSGIAAASAEPIGLLWIDAHMDAHTFETTETGAIHGMPLAALLGRGHAQLTQVLLEKQKLLPQNIALLGVRSYEKGEADLLQQLGVRIFFMDEIKQRGFEVCMNEAIAVCGKDGRPFGVSVDLDAFDPEEVPATGVLCPNGLSRNEVKQALAMISGHAQFCALEIAEYNPALDRNHETAQLIVELIYEACSSAGASMSSKARPSGSKTTAIFPPGKS